MKAALDAIRGEGEGPQLHLRNAAPKSKVLAMQKYAEAQSRAIQQTAAGNPNSCCTFVAPGYNESAKTQQTK